MTNGRKELNVDDNGALKAYKNKHQGNEEHDNYLESNSNGCKPSKYKPCLQASKNYLMIFTMLANTFSSYSAPF